MARERVYKWTKNKDINIFKKYYIFALIIKNSNLSLCIIYNPGIVKNTVACNNSDKKNLDNLLVIYMLHFNSCSIYYVFNNIVVNIRK